MAHLLSKSKKLVLVFSVLLLSSACRLNLLPAYDTQLSEQIDQTAKEVDLFYLNMQEKTNASDDSRNYASFRDKYIQVEVELNSLYTKNRIKPLNKYSTRNCEIALNAWVAFKNEHKKDNTISDGLIRYNRKYMNDLFYTIRIAEEAKK